MGYEYVSNIYGNPEAFGMVLVGEIELAESDYSFDFVIVLKKADGEYYYGHDSGCSCPSPFEDFTSVDDLNGPYTRSALQFNLESLAKDYGVDLKHVRDVMDRL